MFSLRTAIALLVVFTQVWTPVLAQTLPISVDKSVAGQRPVVGVSGNGVPIVNIAPPSAAGVSNNRYTQFNVGPSGVVLNNSGAGSQSQLAGGIGGNPILGNSRATTILNQVTGNNPSQLRGFMEVAGGRANVIVANPAGITCDGCGFLNANRGTLTTGLPMLGPDGSVQGFDVTRGWIAVEGNGLYGDNLDQVDLIARTLTLNASVWANRLSVVAGPATVSYGDGSVQARAGEDAAPAVALDMAALGGMYANSIRLIGTEAGVGVNIGGNLTAMTGDLEVTAAGDVRILPAGKAQAAGNVRMDSARAIGVDGAATAGGGITLNAAGNITTSNAVSANGDLRMTAGGAMTLGGSVGTGGSATFTSAGDLVASNVITANGNLQMDAGRALAIGGKVASGGDIVLRAVSDVSVSNAVGAVGGMVLSTGGSLVQSGAGGLQANRGLTATAGGSLTLGGTTASQGGITLTSGGTTDINGLVSAGQGLGIVAGGNLLQGRGGRIEATGSLSGSSAAGINLAGTTVAQGGITLQSTAAMAIDGQLTSGQALMLDAGGNLTQAAGGNVQADGRFTGLSGGAISLAGSSAAFDDLALTSRNGMMIAGQVATGRNATLTVGGDLATGAVSKVQADGQVYAVAGNVAIGGLLGTTGAGGANGANGLLTVNAAQDMTVTGTVSSAAPLNVTVGRNLSVTGTLLATGGGLSISSGLDTTIGAAGRAQSTGDLSLQSGGKLSAGGIVSSNNAVQINADGDARVDGILAALGGSLSLNGKSDLTVGSAGRVQAATTMTAQAGRDLVLAGSLSSVQTLTLDAVRDVRIDGIAATDAGLSVTARDITLGGTAVAQAASGLAIQAAGALASAGKIVSDGLVTLQSTGDLALSGTTASTTGNLKLSSTAGDLTLVGTAKTQAAGLLDASAARDLSVAGTTSSNGAITLAAGRDVTLGGITAALGGDLRMDAGSAAIIAADGRAQAAGTLTLNAGTTLRNEGLLSAGTDGVLSGADGLTNVGTAVAAQDLKVSTLGAFNNTGSLLAGLNDQGQVALPGSLTLSGSSLINSGLAAAGKNVTLDAASLTLSGGTVSANQALSAVTLGDITARGATLYGGTVSLSGASLDNSHGSLSSNGDLTLAFSGLLNNQAGSIATNGALDVGGSQILNQGGKMLAQDLTLTSPGVVNNTGGLLQGTNTLTLSAGSLVNADTPSADPTRALGVVGKTVLLNAASIDNTRGTLAASDALTLGATLLQNASGLVTSGGTADITAGTLANDGGNVVAGTRLSMTLNALTGTGTLQSQGDLSLTMSGGLINTGSVVAGRDATLSIAGDLDNRGKISAGRNLTVGANTLTNEASGEIVSNGMTTLNVTNALNNAGLIDGGVTHIQAGSVLNTGRIYGDTLAISTAYLRNDVGAAGAGVIASRGNLDLGIGVLDNLEHSLIYAAGDLGIGGALDALWRATGQAQAVNNASATIEAGGNAAISAAAINNINNHYASEVVQVSAGDKVYYRLNGTTDMLDGAIYWLCDQTTAMCSKDPAWLEDDQERRLLLPSSTYPESQYGPPFDYALGGHGSKGEDAPVRRPYIPSWEACAGGDAGPTCYMVPEEFLYPIDAKIWDVFGVEHPTPLPRDPALGSHCATVALCEAEQAEYDQAHATYVALYETLDARVLAYNQDFNSRLVKDFTIYKVTQTVTETQTTATDPGKIIAAGNATLTGAVLNDKSQIVAGGALTVSGSSVQNIGAVGERRIDAVGSEIYTYEKNNDRKYDTVPYSGTLSTEPIGVPVGSYGGGVASPSTGAAAPGASAPVSAVAPITVNSVQLPGTGIVRTVTPPSSVPNSQLYTVVPSASSPYLVTTDSRFTGSKPTISSDYLLSLLGAGGSVQGAGSVSRPTSGVGVTPTGNLTGSASPTQAAIGALQVGTATGGGAAAGGTTVTDSGTNPYLQGTDTLKRLGDGFYEQKLVTDQIIAATGQRFVGDYTDNETQYKDLLTAGATFAQQYGLQVGTPLSEDQMKQLTTDMVWLVDQTVTLADGSTQTVLVPQVYLVVQDGDLKGDGTLMAGRTTTLTVDGAISNTGTIASRDATVMVADNILNQAGGVIQGSIVDLNARQDLSNIAALIKGDTVALQAGRDINLTSNSASTSANSGASQTWSTYVSGVATIDAGNLLIDAGRDLNLLAAAIGIKEDGRLSAGNDINLLTIGTEQGESVVFKKKNTSDVDRQADVGSAISAGGDLTLIAGRDVNATAATVDAGGQLAVGAGRDINVVAGEASGSARDEHYQKYKGSWGKTTTKESVDKSDWTQAQGSTFTGDSAVFVAGRDITVTGSDIGTNGDLSLTADRNVTIAAAENSSNDNQYHREKTSGWGGLGGLSKGTKESTDSLDGTTVFHTGSTVGSVEGNVLITAGEHAQVIGSNVLAKEGDIAVVGEDVLIANLNDTNQEKEYHEVRTSGFSINFGSPVIEAIRTTERLSHDASKTDNPIMQALAFTTVGLAASNASDTVNRGGKQGGGAATITLDFGVTKSTSATDRASSSVFGSTVAAGNNLTIVARGKGAVSDITVLGSSLSAGNNAVLSADGDILLQAAANTSDQQTKTSSLNGSVGVGVMAGYSSDGGYGYGFIARGSASGSHANEDGSDLTWTNSSVTAGNILALQSGGDTSFVGATGKANQIVAAVSGDLLLKSLQDKSTYRSDNQNFGASGTYCYGYCSSSYSVSAGIGKLNSSWESVTHQSGLWAGDGGFQIDVAGNTSLVGSVIAGSNQAVAEGLNWLSTGTLQTSGIENTAKYEGYQVSAGYGSGGSDWGGASAPAAAFAFGNGSSTTESAISGGIVLIRDAQGQLALTGKTAAETLSVLNRDTSDTTNDLDPIFDEEKVRAGFDIVITAQQQASTFLANRAMDEQEAWRRAGNETLTDAERAKAVEDALNIEMQWGTGRPYRNILNAVLAGASGNVAGSALQALQSMGVNYLQSLSAGKVKEIADELGSESARAALHAIVGCAGAVASNSSCGSGALGAGLGSIINSLLADDAGAMTSSERNGRRDLIASIVGGIAVSAGLNPSTAMYAGISETENNYLSASDLKALLEAKQLKATCTDSACVLAAQAEVDRLTKLSAERQDALEHGCSDQPSACDQHVGEIRADIAELEGQISSLSGSAKTTAELNLRQARNLLTSNLEVKFYDALSTLSAQGEDVSLLAPADLAALGLLSGQDARDLESSRGQTGSVLAQTAIAAILQRVLGGYSVAPEAAGVATAGNAVVGAVANANFAQKKINALEVFSPDGARVYSELAGIKIATVDDLSAAIQSGRLTPSQLPVDYVVTADGTKLILNTRTSVALSRAGIPQSQWSGVNKTGVPVPGASPGTTFDTLAAQQLKRNGLPPTGTSNLPKGRR